MPEPEPEKAAKLEPEPLSKDVLVVGGKYEAHRFAVFAEYGMMVKHVDGLHWNRGAADIVRGAARRVFGIVLCTSHVSHEASKVTMSAARSHKVRIAFAKQPTPSGFREAIEKLLKP